MVNFQYITLTLIWIFVIVCIVCMNKCFCVYVKGKNEETFFGETKRFKLVYQNYLKTDTGFMLVYDQ